jgi:hypothetical protein
MQPQYLRRFGFVAELLVIVAASFVAFLKDLRRVYSRILLLNIFELAGQLTHHLIVFFAARAGV